MECKETTKTAMNILFIGKQGDKNAIIAGEYVKQIFPNSLIIFGKRGDKLPEDLNFWKGDYIFSYLSPWIIPQSLLNRAKYGGINWHPGPPEYPGIGCTNFAVYNNEETFGITCHYMNGKVDTGKIIEVKGFRILENDTVYSITQKCYSLIIVSFYQVIDHIIHGHRPILPSGESWKREPYTRKELNELCEIKADMTDKEIDRRIKATTYDKPWAVVNVKGKKFYYREY